jgi:hypothetical protein
MTRARATVNYTAALGLCTFQPKRETRREQLATDEKSQHAAILPD